MLCSVLMGMHHAEPRAILTTATSALDPESRKLDEARCDRPITADFFTRKSVTAECDGDFALDTMRSALGLSKVTCVRVSLCTFPNGPPPAAENERPSSSSQANDCSAEPLGVANGQQPGVPDHFHCITHCDPNTRTVIRNERGLGCSGPVLLSSSSHSPS